MAVQYGRLLITCKPAVHVNKKAGVCEWKLKLFTCGHFGYKKNIYFDVSYLMGFIADPIKYESSVPIEMYADIDTFYTI